MTVQIVVVKICSEWVRSHSWKTCPVWWEEVIILKQALSSKQTSTHPWAYATRKKWITIKRTKSSATESRRCFLLFLSVSENPFKEVIFKRVFLEKVPENIFSMMEIKVSSFEACEVWTSRWLGAIVAVEIVGFPFVFIGKNLVGLRDLLKLGCGFLFVIRIFIRMPLDGKLSIGLLDFILIGSLLYA